MLAPGIDMTWMGDAACEPDPAWTTTTIAGRYGEREVDPNPTTLVRLAGICAGCPVIRECASYALDANVSGGMYAGVWIPSNSSAWSTRRTRDARRALLARAVRQP